ncbi:MAG TPA: glutamate-5-semialdehyde dehydrogenase [Methanomassiliicoccales archaeon]|nr:glutamate-5-semialdehyde dehydrogenase [Methanomassiliicoccales archaeon]
MVTTEEAAEGAKRASFSLSALPLAMRNEALAQIAKRLQARRSEIIAANDQDMEDATCNSLAAPLLKRLRYDSSKIDESMLQIDSLIGQEDPIGKVLSRTELDAGLILEKVSCPIGVIGIVFESRPDALVQISTLCLKSGNAVLLKGGSEARHTNEALAKTINEAITKVDPRFQGAVHLISTREEFRSLLVLDGLVDLIIPRGSNELVRSIQESTKIPVLGHAAGICHTYVHEDADIALAIKVCYDAKVQYPAVCNAVETLLVNEKTAKEFLPLMAAKLEDAQVEIKGDVATRGIIKAREATISDWGKEYNDLILNIKVVGSLQEAVDHINKYGSHHTDAIITKSEETAESFMSLVDSASVMWNCSTRFADGFRYGLGAEVGISTSKTHARGPVGLEGLTIYKWKLRGDGQIVADYVGKGAKEFTHRKLL